MGKTRRAINEAEVRRYFASWEPTWRWVLILGMRDMRAHLDRIGRVAADEMGNQTWADENYVYGPLALGVTAAAVNEASQHCEDLFALLSFLRDPRAFARRIGGYSAGRVVRLADTLRKDSDAAIASRFCIPAVEKLQAGLAKASDPEGSGLAVRDGISRLGGLVRSVVTFYETYEFFHVQYKHGLKVLFRPFGGNPSAEVLAERKSDLKAPLLALSNETLSKMVERPPQQQAMMLHVIPEAQPHLAELVENRDLLRVQMSGPPVDLDSVAALSRTISRLMRLASTNRLALGAFDEDGQQIFKLPGIGDRETVSIRIEPEEPLGLDNVA
jgi:hypothetical protein